MKYVKNEWMKLWSQKSSWMMLVFLLIIVIGFAAISKYYEDPQNTSELRQEINQSDITLYESFLTDADLPEEDRRYYEEEIMLSEYRIAHDLPSPSATTFDSHMLSVQQITLALVGIFMVVVAASILSNEFSTGTIKMLLTRPVTRWKIALSKLATVFLYGVTTLVATFIVGAIVGVVLWGTTTVGTLAIVDGAVVQQSSMDLFIDILLYSISPLLIDTLLAFLLGSVFGSSTLAVGIALLISLMGNVIIMLISGYSFAKYIWFANDLRQYVPGNSPLIPDLTFSFSLTVSIIYMIVFLAITIIHFQKRDITA